MRQNTSAYLVASIASAFIPPRIARILALVMILGLAGVLLWILRDESLAFGMVTETLPPGVIPDLLAKIQGLSFGDAALVLRVPAALAESQNLQAHDLVLAFSIQETVAGNIFEVTSLQNFPIGRYWDWMVTAADIIRLTEVHPAGLLMLAAAIVLFSDTVLRTAAAAVMAGIVGTTAFMAMTLNLPVYVLPIPASYITTLTIAGIAVGAVIGFKSLIRDKTNWAAPLAAACLALAFIPFAPNVLPKMPAETFWAMPLAGLMLPSLIPTILACGILLVGLEIDDSQMAAALSGLFGLYAVVTWFQMTGRRAKLARSAFVPQTNARGEFPFEQILNDPRGA
jgi:hypothetical protein